MNIKALISSAVLLTIVTHFAYGFLLWVFILSVNIAFLYHNWVHNSYGHLREITHRCQGCWKSKLQQQQLQGKNNNVRLSSAWVNSMVKSIWEVRFPVYISGSGFSSLKSTLDENKPDWMDEMVISKLVIANESAPVLRNIRKVSLVDNGDIKLDPKYLTIPYRWPQQRRRS